MAFPCNNNNKNDSRQLEEVTLFHPIRNTAPDLRGNDIPVSCTAAVTQTHSWSRGDVTAPGCSGSTGNPISSSRSKWRIIAMASISGSLGSWRKLSATPHHLHKFLLCHTWNQTFAFLLWYQTQKNATHNPKEKCRERNIENSLFLKRKNVIFLSVVL